MPLLQNGSIISVVFLRGHYQEFCSCQGNSRLHSRFRESCETLSHSNNGIFASKAFKNCCQASSPSQPFAAVGAHNQNGVVKHYIGVISTCARTMLPNAMAMWPDMITADFWSSAFLQDTRIHNVTPRHGEPHHGESKCPFTLFTDADPPLSADALRVFGCPVYVLDKSLQDGTFTSGGKWKERCHLGVWSYILTGHVAMVYNPATKLASPQYHVVFDEDFETVNLGSPLLRKPWLKLISCYRVSSLTPFGSIVVLIPTHRRSLTTTQIQLGYFLSRCFRSKLRRP